MAKATEKPSAGSPEAKPRKRAAPKAGASSEAPAPAQKAPLKRARKGRTPAVPAGVDAADQAWKTAREAIRHGQNGDPFAVLGPHPSIGGGVELTVFQPGAERVAVLLPDAAPQDLEALGEGLFRGHIAQMRDRHQAYRLSAEQGGTRWEWDDPYRFGPVLGELDEYLLGEGRHQRLWHALGAHVIHHEGAWGVHFAVWAPNARRVSVIGAFNLWDGRRHPMRKRGASGFWEIFLPDLEEGCTYRYEIQGQDGVILPLKADPVGFGSEHAPANASVVRRIDQARWQDADWMRDRAASNSIDAPISIYEVHLGSWRRAPGGRMLSYTEMAEQLVTYAADMGFTHIELLPVSEFPFDGSWGYQPVGLFAPTIRHGTPDEFRALIDAAHRKGLGVLLDWVPGHFPSDPHGLGRFDGTALYEHEDPREGFHLDWNTLIYNYGRREVQNYLVSNAVYWLEEYHIDGLRVDAVASMLYRDYSREPGQWVPNKDGGRENYEAIGFLRDMNTAVYGLVPGVMTAAEESTSFPGVSRPVWQGGLGFGFKWNMGWMNDLLTYMARDPLFRRHHHNEVTFGILYAWSENFILPISHDEVVHGKGSMYGKMPGNHEQKFANLRAFYSYMWGHPGKKLLFMGCEFGQAREWAYLQSLDWHLLEEEGGTLNRGLQRLIRDLNTLYRAEPALHVNDCRTEGFQWLDPDNADESLLSWLRFGQPGDAPVAVVVNMTPVVRHLRIGLPQAGAWQELLNTDADIYGGENRGNLGTVFAEPVPAQGQAFSAQIVIPPLAGIFLRFSGVPGDIELGGG